MTRLMDSPTATVLMERSDKLLLKCCINAHHVLLWEAYKLHCDRVPRLSLRNRAPHRITQLLQQWLHLVTVKIKPSQTPAHFPWQDNQKQQPKHTHTVRMQGRECGHVLFLFFLKRESETKELLPVFMWCGTASSVIMSQHAQSLTSYY